MSRTQLVETSMTWARTMDDLKNTFRLWGVESWEVKSLVYGAGAASRQYPVEQRQVAIRFVHPDGHEVTVVKSDWERPVDNLRQLYHGLEAMRVIYNKNLESVIRAAYLQLDAPATQVDPYELLGVRPDAALEDIEAMWKIKAKRVHPDAPGGGDAAAMTSLNAAIERIRADRKGEG